MKNVLFLMLCSFGISSLFAATPVPASVTASQSWTLSGSPYEVGSDVVIQNGVTITVEPGVVIQGSGNYKITINGTMELLGSSAQPVHINSVTLYFDKKATDYHPGTQTGCRILYSQFVPYNNSGGYCIQTAKTDLLISHCRFEKSNYPIYAMGNDTVKLWVRNCRILGGNSCYAVYGTYRGSYLELTDDTITNLGYFYLGETTVMRRNYLEGNTSSYGLYSQSITKKLVAECNLFRKCNYGIYIYSLDPGFQSIRVNNNYFDSGNYCIYLQCKGLNPDSVVVHENHFSAKYKAIYLMSPTASTAVRWDIGNNYWGTTDTNLVKSSIYDNRNSANIPFRSDFNTVLSSPPAACWPVSAMAGLNPDPQRVVMQIYPNPVKGIATLETDRQIFGTVFIADIQGRMIKKVPVTQGKIQFSTLDLPAGTYLVTLASAQGSSAAKLLVP
ncbi:MAG: T9SS type A sorting domain-containing protein [Bacteroidia bacterium]|nr:T9SS type A sorting domain-containing protein [Bacteroidia bacterium]